MPFSPASKPTSCSGGTYRGKALDLLNGKSMIAFRAELRSCRLFTNAVIRSFLFFVVLPIIWSPSVPSTVHLRNGRSVISDRLSAFNLCSPRVYAVSFSADDGSTLSVPLLLVAFSSVQYEGTWWGSCTLKLSSSLSFRASKHNNIPS